MVASLVLLIFRCGGLNVMIATYCLTVPAFFFFPQMYASQYFSQISELLRRLPRVILLMLKTNDCLRAVNNSLVSYILPLCCPLFYRGIYSFHLKSFLFARRAKNSIGEAKSNKRMISNNLVLTT